MSISQLAIIFPGQGSQKIGMLSSYADEAVVRDTFAEGSDIIGKDLWDIATSGPQAIIDDTKYTQPVLLTAGVSVWRLWQQRNGIVPQVLAGHSLGEYTALVCAGAIEFTDAVNIVHKRGEFMQQAVAPGEGAMAAIIGMDLDAITKVCNDAAQGEVVQAVNINSPGQIVIAGNNAAVDRAMEAALVSGAKKVLKLPVSAPSHCDLMLPAANKLKELLATIEINTPHIKVVHNVDAKTHDNPDEIRQALYEQLYKPVQWIKCVESIAAMGVDTVIESAPNKVLCGLVKRIDKALKLFHSDDLLALENSISELSKEVSQC